MANEEREAESGQERGPAQPERAAEPITARAVRTTRGRAATTIQVEVEPARVTGREDPESVEEVVAEVPTAEGDAGTPRWEEQPLDSAGAEVEDGHLRKLRYVGTRYEGCDASTYGIKVKVKTAAGTLARAGIRVREADKPEEADPSRDPTS